MGEYDFQIKDFLNKYTQKLLDFNQNYLCNKKLLKRLSEQEQLLTDQDQNEHLLITN